ncbi:hypothetical protein A2976_00055 [candidate division WWE3 bacterium RIFCSPLOWO2_01_FULL_41_9]|uniref:Uncharacterized protein n=1 Tax=candidate division WWE3 bacterium RIFCSPLOWO2_01_FULL_41_9 TaxID=1802626 RepID=A0A1F4VMJ9_UNCKA|nr:MAG: hypothetical protein A2976_00055 [candidate division WWE3 bacterium RIFCSPLOWO2_01_FULL_41_9]
MPKSIFTMMLIDALLWFYWIRELFNTRPETTESVLRFLLLLFFALGLALSFPFYFYFFKKAPDFTNLRLLYRRCLKWGFYLSFGTVFLFGLRAFHALTILNVVLFLVLYVAIFHQIRGRG